MLICRSLAALFCAGALTYASTLDVYQDKSFYRYTPKSSFVGFTQGIEATCEARKTILEPTLSCPDELRLCKLSQEIKTAKQSLAKVRYSIDALKTLIELPNPKSYDAAGAIKSARAIGEERALLEHEEQERDAALELLSKQFATQAPSQEPKVLRRACKGELVLTIPRGYISFDNYYEAEISKDKEISLTQYLTVTNRSGIDIDADHAMFYYRSASSYLNLLHFSPWIVSKYTPMPKRMLKKSAIRATPMEIAMDSMAAEAVPISSASSASYEDARVYKVNKLTLPSNGEPLDIPILQWKAPISCELRAYPYLSAQAVEVCAFEPKYQIEKNRWKLKEGKRIINENAIGEYANGKYELYTHSDPDIKIRRHPIVKKERTSGIFGGTVRKKDGYRLELTNKSDKTKKLKIIERIPTSTTEEIKVKLLEVKSESKVDYHKKNDGKIEIDITLKPHEHRRIAIWFELSYDKDMKVNY